MKPPLIYTIERSGKHFINYCFDYLFNDSVISTHDKTRKNTLGEHIDYKNYKVFATIREPKNIIISELNLIYEMKPNIVYEKKEIVFREEYLIERTKLLLDIQKAYFNDLIDNKDFYIMPFKFFTKDTKQFFLKLATDNCLSQEMVDKINTDLFFNNPLEHIFKDLYDPIRYPRNNDNIFKKQILLLVQKFYMDGKFDHVNKLYSTLEKRYLNGQQIA